jgi:hypothetical protein
MYVSVRTTLIIEDPLFREAKQKAAATGTTLSELMNSALRRFLFAPTGSSSEKTEKFSMPVFGDSAKVHHDPSQLAELRDEGR